MNLDNEVEVVKNEVGEALKNNRAPPSTPPQASPRYRN